MWTRIPYSARIGLPVRQYVMGAAEAARKPILPHGKIRTEKNGKNSTERYGIPNFRRFRKSLATSGGQTFPKSTEIRNSVAFRAVFSVFFRPCFSVVAESVSEQLLQRTGGLGGQFWLSKESVSTSATDCRIPTPICTKYGLQKVRTYRIDGLYR